MVKDVPDGPVTLVCVFDWGPFDRIKYENLTKEKLKNELRITVKQVKSLNSWMRPAWYDQVIDLVTFQNENLRE